VLDLVRAAEVIVPLHPGLFSALGLVSSDQVYEASRSAYTILNEDATRSVDAVYREMEAALRDRLRDVGDELRFVRSFDGRLVGQTWETPFIPVPEDRIDPEEVRRMVANFHAAYRVRTGNSFTMLPVQGVTYRVQAVIPSAKVEYPKLDARRAGEVEPRRTTQIRYLADRPIEAGEFDRSALRHGDEVAGPAIIREPLSTTFVLPGQALRVGGYGELHIGKSS
jgi:N-methylhydantoinase A